MQLLRAAWQRNNHGKLCESAKMLETYGDKMAALGNSGTLSSGQVGLCGLRALVEGLGHDLLYILLPIHFLLWLLLVSVDASRFLPLPSSFFVSVLLSYPPS